MEFEYWNIYSSENLTVFEDETKNNTREDGAALTEGA